MKSGQDGVAGWSPRPAPARAPGSRSSPLAAPYSPLTAGQLSAILRAGQLPGLQTAGPGTDAFHNFAESEAGWRQRPRARRASEDDIGHTRPGFPLCHV